MIKLIDAIGLVLYCLFIFYLSDQPGSTIPMNFPHQDKIYHVGAYFIMAVLSWRTFRHEFPEARAIAFLFCSVYGFSDEWHQTFVEGRHSELADWLADCLGIGLGLFFWTNSQLRTGSDKIEN